MAVHEDREKSATENLHDVGFPTLCELPVYYWRGRHSGLNAVQCCLIHTKHPCFTPIRWLSLSHLFTYLDPDFEKAGINATTNMSEGALNSGIRRTLRDHRGMPTEHRRTAAEWFCWTHAESLGRPSLGSLVRPEHYAPQVRAEAVQEVEEQIGPELYGTAAIAEEGLYARQGRGGRSR